MSILLSIAFALSAISPGQSCWQPREPPNGDVVVVCIDSATAKFSATITSSERGTWHCEFGKLDSAGHISQRTCTKSLVAEPCGPSRFRFDSASVFGSDSVAYTRSRRWNLCDEPAISKRPLTQQEVQDGILFKAEFARALGGLIAILFTAGDLERMAIFSVAATTLAPAAVWTAYGHPEAAAGSVLGSALGLGTIVGMSILGHNTIGECYGTIGCMGGGTFYGGFLGFAGWIMLEPYGAGVGLRLEKHANQPVAVVYIPF